MAIRGSEDVGEWWGSALRSEPRSGTAYRGSENGKRRPPIPAQAIHIHNSPNADTATNVKPWSKHHLNQLQFR